MPMAFYRKQFSDFKYYPPCTNLRVREIMNEHDALILPSIVEGRALVQQEAMSCGLPIVATPNAGGEDLIDEGITGHLIPIQSPAKIAEKILSLQDAQENKTDIKKACVRKAKSYTWTEYAQMIIDFNLNKKMPKKFD